jgi:hypothetical protein
MNPDVWGRNSLPKPEHRKKTGNSATRPTDKCRMGGKMWAVAEQHQESSCVGLRGGV